ncbi:MAG: hypothetical protein IJT87_10115 [Ruminiclostridium sp.]|nr:hypothetical protein [Ruminiclostridium sp.]
MLKDRLKTIMKAIDATTRSLAEYTGISYPNIGKITNGSRVPTKKLSSTTPKLVNGIYGFAETNNKLGVLCETVGCDTTIGEKEIKKALLDWLYEDTPQPESGDVRFRERFLEIQTIVGAEVIEIARHSGVSLEIVKKITSSARAPSRYSEVLNSISETLLSLAEENGVMPEVCEAMGITEQELSEMNAVPVLMDWLKGRTSAADSYIMSQVVGSMMNPTMLPAGLPAFERVAVPEILDESEPAYVGTGGLQRAVIRFLGNAARRPRSELLLYSDQDMEWMQASFTPKWLSLMRECLQNGVKMKIIHNIDRDPSEMLFALKSWMPLYMTGLVEPYYRTDKSGERFRHTMFIGESGCIEGYCAAGAERDCIYHYITDTEKLGHIRDSYDKMLSGAAPLVTVEKGISSPKGDHNVYENGGIRIYTSVRSAAVCKLTEPQMTFKFRHPYLLKMLSQYAQTFMKTSEKNE